MGAGGIVAEGVFNSNSLLVETERTMMATGQEVIVVADSTKFGRLSLARLCGLEEISRIVVDRGLADGYRELLDSRGVPVHFADNGDAHATSNGTASPTGLRNGS